MRALHHHTTSNYLQVSEGLDFSDMNGRAVVITGFPYPSLTDAKVCIYTLTLYALIHSHSVSYTYTLPICIALIHSH
jgi:hypothetical protein